ncbi:MAG: permease prefix domain 1-containing protein [Planctomycetaceae bacterium]
MPDQDFDLFLSLLSKLLRFDPRQAQAVRDELRDHLEERYEALRAEGKSRDEAIRQAVEEFGDAASLAQEFAQLAQLRRKRWIMRATFAGSLLLLSGLTLAILFWPTPPHGDGHPVVVADDQRGGRWRRCEHFQRCLVRCHRRADHHLRRPLSAEGTAATDEERADAPHWTRYRTYSKPTMASCCWSTGRPLKVTG